MTKRSKLYPHHLCQCVTRKTLVALASFSFFAQISLATDSIPVSILSDSPIDVFVDVMNFSTPQSAGMTIAKAKNLSVIQERILLILCRWASPSFTNGLHWHSLSDNSLNGAVWRMEDQKERMSWFLGELFDLNEQKNRLGYDSSSGERFFSALLDECDAVLDERSKRENAKRTLNVIAHMNTMNTDELIALAEREQSETILQILSSNSNERVRVSVAKSDYASFELLNSMRKDSCTEVAEAAKMNLRRAHSFDYDSMDTSMLMLLKTVVFADASLKLDNLNQAITALSIRERKTFSLWLASRLADLRFSPTPGEKSPPPGHDLSLIGGKCAYLLEKILGEKLVPVRRDTPLGTLEKQRERLMKRVQEMQ